MNSGKFDNTTRGVIIINMIALLKTLPLNFISVNRIISLPLNFINSFAIDEIPIRTRCQVLFHTRAENSDCIADFQLGSDKAVVN
jgi:hypothetical protein